MSSTTVKEPPPRVRSAASASRLRPREMATEPTPRASATVAILGDFESLATLRELAAAAEVRLMPIEAAQVLQHSVTLSNAEALRHVSPRHTRHLSELLVLTEDPTPECYDIALQHRATQVITLPAESERLLAFLVSLSKPTVSDSRVIGVLGGCSGAGASALASTIALSARDSALLIDADPGGGGLDLLLGIEDDHGLRWNNLAAAAGTLPLSTILSSLPTVQSTKVLSFGREHDREAWHDSVVATAEALATGISTCVIDLSRTHHITPSLANLCHEIYVVVPRHVRALAAAALLLEHDDLRHLPLHLVTRGPAPAGITPADVAEFLERDVVGDYSTSARQQRAFLTAVEHGYGPLTGSGRSARRLARKIAHTPLHYGRPA